MLNSERSNMPHSSVDDRFNSRVDDRMREIQSCINGVRLPDASRICLLIEFCYLLELHQQAIDLYARLDKNDVSSDWLLRVDAIVRASKMNL